MAVLTRRRHSLNSVHYDHDTVADGGAAARVRRSCALATYVRVTAVVAATCSAPTPTLLDIAAVDGLRALGELNRLGDYPSRVI